MMHQNDSLLAVGSIAFDTIQTPVAKEDKVLGGSVNYFSIAASFYSSVGIVGVVGNDFPESHFNWLASRGVDVSAVQRESGETFHWSGSYDQSFSEAKTLSTHLNVFSHFNPKLSEKHKKSSFVFLANIDPLLQLSLLEQVEAPKWVACDSMNFWITSKPNELKEVLKRVDIVFLNEQEICSLSGEKDSFRAAQKIQQLGPKNIVIKKGKYGAILFCGDSVFQVPAYPVEKVVDPTGAGDSFAGAFLGFLAKMQVDRSLSEKEPKQWIQLLRKSLLAGCVMASFTVQDFGFRRLQNISLADLLKRQEELVKIVK